MFTERTQIKYLTSFDDEPVLQPQIRRAIEDKKNSGVSLAEINGLRKPEETDD